MTLEDDLALILAGGADTFTAGAVSTACDLYTEDAVADQGQDGAGLIVGQTWTMVQASLFPDLRTNSECTVSGKSYVVASVERIQDGRVFKVALGSTLQYVGLDS